MGTDATRTCALPGSNFDKIDAHWEDGEVIDGDMVCEKRKAGLRITLTWSCPLDV